MVNIFDTKLTAFNETLIQQVFPKSPLELYEPCQYFLSIGGKRIRPLMCFVGNLLFNKEHSQTKNLAMAIELFHNFTLMHDDIMDQSTLRRNKETVHIKYSQSTAILSGDVMLINAYKLLENIEEPLFSQIFKLLNKTAAEVCEGQQYDMMYEQSEHLQLEEYMNMIRLKTAVLFATALEMGAIMGKAAPDNLFHIRQFGLNLGLAFQIQDDYLDSFGNEKDFGKMIGNDILHKKKTILSVFLLSEAGDVFLQQFRNLNSPIKPDNIASILKLYEACGAKEYTLQKKQELLDTALNHLKQIVNYNPTYYSWLNQFANNLSLREV